MATYYINADTGNDSTGDGSIGTPWLTFDKALDNIASSGDTIIAVDSTAAFSWDSKYYNDPISKSFTLEGQSTDASGAVFDASNVTSTSNTGYWAFDSSVTVTIKNITFTNINNGTTAAPCFEPRDTNNTVSFENCIFHDITVNSSYHLGGIAALNNGTTAAGSVFNFTNCLVYDITWGGVTPASGWSQSSLFGNRQNATASMNFTGCAMRLGSSHGFDADFGILGELVGTFTVKNCIFEDPDNTVKYATNGSTTTYSCTYQLTQDPAGTGNITSDPLWVDPDNVNFDLQPDSPCGWGTGVLT